MAILRYFQFVLSRSTREVPTSLMPGRAAHSSVGERANDLAEHDSQTIDFYADLTSVCSMNGLVAVRSGESPSVLSSNLQKKIH